MNKHVVFIGDSMTSGENNGNKSYAHYFQELNKESVVNILGVSGSCFGNYSIYPVEDNLVSLIDSNQYKFKNADLVVIEFGVNDAAAVSLGYVDLIKVYISINRAVDFIRQLCSAEILFILALDSTHHLTTTYLHKYLDYLNNEYLLKGIQCDLNKLQVAYNQIDAFVRSNFNVVFMNSDLLNNIDIDNIHPNDDGYKQFAERLTKYINEC